MSWDDENQWDYAGELVDPAQTPITTSVYTCRKCGALVAGFGAREVHEQWHTQDVR